MLILKYSGYKVSGNFSSCHVLAAYFAINLLCAKLVWRKISMFCMLYYFIWFSAKSWNSASRKTKTCMSHTVDTCIMAISKITFNIRWNLKKANLVFIAHLIIKGWHQREQSKRIMGSDWPDQRDKTGFGSLARGGENFFVWLSSPT